MKKASFFIFAIVMVGAMTACSLDAATMVGGESNVKSIGEAVANAKAGDVIVVAPGEYDELVTITVSGEKDNPITIKSAEKHGAKVKGFVVKADYITIDGFEITNSDKGANGIDCGQVIRKWVRTGCMIVNNYVHDVEGTAIYAGEHALVKDNLMRNVGRGIYLNSHSLAEDNEVDTLMVTYRMKDGEKKIKKTQYSFFVGENITFRGNYFHGAPEEYLKKGMGVDFFVTWDAWIFGPSKNILIENNRCFNATHACESETLRTKQSSDITFRNNLFVNTVYVGIYCKEFKNITIENNTFINCGAYPVWFRSKRETQGAIVRNNLIAYYKHENRKHGGPEGDAGIRNDFDGEPDAQIESHFNLIYGTQNRQYGQTDFTAKPVFVDPDNGDFRLKTGSPGIDAGMTLSHIKTDQNGVTRPQGEGYDVGAYESKD